MRKNQQCDARKIVGLHKSQPAWSDLGANSSATVQRSRLLVDMHDGRRRETVEIGRGGVAVGADLFAIKQFARFEVCRKIFRHRNHVQRVARRTEYGADLFRAFLECLQMILAMVKNHAGKSVVNAVVNVVAQFSIAHGLADDFGNSRRRSRAQEPARFGKNLEFFRQRRIIFWKQPVQFAVDDFRQFTERFDAGVVGRRKTAANIEQVHLVVTAFACFFENIRGQVDGLDVILKIRRLAADVETDALDRQARPIRFQNQIHRLAGRRAELGG